MAEHATYYPDGGSAHSATPAPARAVTTDKAAAVADLGQTISGAYTQAEVQAISDKTDELLASLRASGLLDS